MFWSDPSGLSATSSEFTHDFMGRARFDKYGMFIPPFERQYKSITTDGFNGEGSGGGGGGGLKFETVDEILSFMLKSMNQTGIDRLTYKPGDGFYYYEQYSVVDKHKYQWNNETQQYELGGAGVHFKKVYVQIASNQNYNFNNNGLSFYYTNHGLNIAGGLFKGLETLTYSDKGWLGNNGKIYNTLSGRGPNQHTGSRGGAKASSNSYRKAGNGLILVSLLIGAYKTIEGYQKDGNSFGYNAQHALASSAFGIFGGYVGGKIGVSVGGLSTAWAGGVPGAAIGGVVGSVAGSYGGSFLGGFMVDIIHKK